MAFRLSPHLTVMANAAQKAAKRLLRDFAEVEQLQVSMKGPSDFVSAADLRAEATLKEELTKARPGYSFLMEESGASGSDNWSWRWIVDPLDGTTNFLHGMPHWAISIGLERRLTDGTSEIHAGLIYAPAADEMFWAEKGTGAFMNERRLRVSARREIAEAVFATGIPFGAVSAPRRQAFSRTLTALMPQVAGIRRFGAAALDLAWVAHGRFDGYWELGIKPWDIAAGELLVREAGGYATDVGDGSPLATGNIVAGNPHLHAKLRTVVAEGMQPPVQGPRNGLEVRYQVDRIDHSLGYSIDGIYSNGAESYFSRLHRAAIRHHHQIAGAYLVRHAQESAWREGIIAGLPTGSR